MNINNKIRQQLIFMRRQIILPAVIIMFWSCNAGKDQQPIENAATTATNTVTLTDAQFRQAGIQTGALEQHQIAAVIKLSGSIDVPPQNLASISMPLGGYLKKTILLPGMHINKGDIIAVLEDQQYIQLQQDYLVNNSELEMAAAEYNRQQELNASKAGSDKVLEQAKAQYEAARVKQSALSEKLRLIHINPEKLSYDKISRSVNIYAPFTGFVSRVNVNIGKYVSPSDVLFELVNPDDIHLNLGVFEKDLNFLSEGQEVIAYTNSNPTKKYPCEILLISKLIPDSKTAEVHCHFEQYDKTLIPGMYMNAEVQVKRNNVAALPEQAVVNFGGANYVFALTGKQQYEMLPVSIGETEGGWVAINNSEAFAHKQIVTSGAYTLLMALKNVAEE